MKRHLECSCCGGSAGKWEQFHNQDTGYGMCARCVDSIVARGPQYLEAHEIDINRTCGLPGVHREPASHEQIKEYGFDVKLFAVIRVKAASEEDARRILSECAGGMDCNGGAWPDGNPILFNASIDGESDLIEIDGEDAA